MTFEAFKKNLDVYLGLDSAVFVDDEGNHFLDYRSPTNILLFTLYCKEENGKWRIRPMSDTLPEFEDLQGLL